MNRGKPTPDCMAPLLPVAPSLRGKKTLTLRSVHMTKEEAASSAKAVYLQAAAMAGKEVASDRRKRWQT